MWGKQSTFENLNMKIYKPENSENGCAEYSVPDGAIDNFAMFVTGLNHCPFGNLIHNAQEINAAAIFILYPKSGDISSISLPNMVAGSPLFIKA